MVDEPNGDTFKDLGKEFDISWKKLVKYNDLQRDYTLMEGDIIYLKSKKKKASKPYTVYVVKDGDSMHGISQKYGIRLKNLYKMNRKDGEYVPEIGDRLSAIETSLKSFEFRKLNDSFMCYYLDKT